ncbi:nucleotidyltransferase domain-containing protein [Thermomicrobiaceae bacterium CFH 74404]|uniref:Nucleotidyltransferase domain-containing protein n=1 Tax=Thermalbibacter longus TaxID=2951981 RepID=A0AA41WBP4_9BACT|nr:nucleotidyltransferase domain-containing protein [Thermalbibacter longus]MCM8749772.1 nucleotidyltransferase domain-containing protein [Thermalbibacter longus]
MQFWTSSVRTWPDRATVDRAVRAWAAALAEGQPQPPIRCVGYFGSYARGDWGFGSDIDLIVIVEEDSTPWMLRPLRYDTISLPVPSDLLVYTVAEWAKIRQEPFGAQIAREVVWVYSNCNRRGVRSADHRRFHP